MIRFILRVVALLALAGGFTMLIIDGTRSIAANQVLLTLFGDTCARLFPTQFPQLEPFVRNLNPLLWDPVLRDLLALPTAVVLVAFGAILFWIARKRPPKIGYSSRP